jgi:hypothetical protein
MTILGFMNELITPFYAMHAKHVLHLLYICFTSFLWPLVSCYAYGWLVLRFLGQKHQLCRCWTVITRLASKLVATASMKVEWGVLLALSSPREQSNSPWRVMLLASRVSLCIRAQLARLRPCCHLSSWCYPCNLL